MEIVSNFTSHQLKLQLIFTNSVSSPNQFTCGTSYKLTILLPLTILNLYTETWATWSTCLWLIHRFVDHITILLLIVTFTFTTHVSGLMCSLSSGDSTPVSQNTFMIMIYKIVSRIEVFSIRTVKSNQLYVHSHL